MKAYKSAAISGGKMVQHWSNSAPLNHAPTDISLSASSIAENNAVGDVIGSLSTTDQDAGNTFTYSLVSGTGSTDNASFSITDANLKAGIAFDYETKSSYSIRVRTTDQGGLYFEKVFTITVTDVFELTWENSELLDNLTTAYNFEETSGLTFVNNVSTAKALVGNASTTINQSGENGKSIYSAGAAALSADVEKNLISELGFSVAFSIKPTSTAAGGLFAIFNPLVSRWISVNFNTDKSLAVNFQLPVGTTFSTPADSIVLNAWNECLMTWDTVNIRMYVNNNLVATQPFSASISEVSNNPKFVVLAQSSVGFVGYFDQLYTWYRVLTSQERSNLFDLSSSGSLMPANLDYYRILVLGNSITRSITNNTTWWGNWGMAATTKDNDFCHKLEDKVKLINPLTRVLPANIAAWEAAHTTYNKANLDVYFAAIPDEVVIRLSENVSNTTGYDTSLQALINYILSKAPNTKISLTGSFWISSAKDAITSAVAAANNLPYTPLSQLYVTQNISAIGTVVSDALGGGTHTINDGAVANHPSDLGMVAIADEVYDILNIVTG